MVFADRRGEPEAGRDGQRFTELLRSLPTAGLGAQILFGFLLVSPFTAMFTRFSGFSVGSTWLLSCSRLYPLQCSWDRSPATG